MIQRFLALISVDRNDSLKPKHHSVFYMIEETWRLFAADFINPCSSISTGS